MTAIYSRGRRGQLKIRDNFHKECFLLNAFTPLKLFKRFKVKRVKKKIEMKVEVGEIVKKNDYLIPPSITSS